MLESAYQQLLARRLAETPCQIELPESWLAQRGKSGLLPSMPDDRRRHARKYRRGLALLELCGSLPAIARPNETVSVVTRDVSRAGLALLHVEQLFPGEQVLLWLPEGKLRATVVRCQKHGDRCFEVAVSTAAALAT